MKKKIALIQPPLLDSQMKVDLIQEKYWEVLGKTVEKMYSENNLGSKIPRSKKNFSGFFEPNIGLFYVAGALKKNNFDITYLDFHLYDAKIRGTEDRVINEKDIELLIANSGVLDCKIIGTSPVTVNYHWVEKYAKTIKKLDPSIIISVGGVHAAFDYKKILENKDIDVVFTGEGEISSVELYNKLFQNNFSKSGLEEIKGIAFINDKGELVHTGNRKQNTELDSLEYPAYEFLPEEYTSNAIFRVLTSRGCSNNCSFCVPSKMFKIVAFRDPIKVVDEMEYLNKRFGCRTIMIGDLNFLNDVEYSKTFCSELKRRNLNIVWLCQSRTDLIDKSIVAMMKDAGCVMICLGVESADINVLKKNNKNIMPDKSLEACKIVKNAGIKLFTYWAFGLPGETHESAHKTILLMKKMIVEKLIDYSHVTMIVPYPGTPLHKNPKKMGIKILSDDYSKYWLGCDYLGAGLPVAETEELSNYEIYAYWQLAMSIVAGSGLN